MRSGKGGAVSLTQREKDIAEHVAKSVIKNQDDCNSDSRSCLIYTNEPKVRDKHLKQHVFVEWLMGWVDPARKQTKSLLIKGFVLLFFAVIAGAIYLATPLRLKGF